MKKTEVATGSPYSKPLDNPVEYPAVIMPESEHSAEEPEEENPAAYALLSKIEDPYYSRKLSYTGTACKDSFHEDNKSNLPIYKSFYSMSPTKSESSSNLNYP